MAHPTFEIRDGERTDHYRVIPQLPPAYFRNSERFRNWSSVTSVEVLNDTQYFEEGDWWALTVISVEHSDLSRTLALLPIQQTILPHRADRQHWTKVEKLLSDRTELIAYGTRSDSPEFGPRDWVAYDAFLDEEFGRTLLGLFGSARASYGLDIDSGADEPVRFSSAIEVDDFIMSNECTTNIQQNGDVNVVCGPLKLSIPISTRGTRSDSAREGEEVGHIWCVTNGDSVTVGTLRTTVRLADGD